MRESRRKKTRDVCFLLSDIPEVIDVEKIGIILTYLAVYTLNQISLKEGFDWCCEKLCRDPTITIKTIK